MPGTPLAFNKCFLEREGCNVSSISTHRLRLTPCLCVGSLCILFYNHARPLECARQYSRGEDVGEYEGRWR